MNLIILHVGTVDVSVTGWFIVVMIIAGVIAAVMLDK